MRRKDARPPLLVKVWAELGAGRITEDVITSDVKGERIYGYKEGRHIWVNPAWTMAETIVHELLHRVNPAWSERYVANRTTYLLNRMTDAEVQALHDEYQTRVKKRKRRDRKVPAAGGRLVAQRDGEANVQEVRRGPDDPRGDGLPGGAGILPGVQS